MQTYSLKRLKYSTSFLADQFWAHTSSSSVHPTSFKISTTFEFVYFPIKRDLDSFITCKILTIPNRVLRGRGKHESFATMRCLTLESGKSSVSTLGTWSPSSSRHPVENVYRANDCMSLRGHLGAAAAACEPTLAAPGFSFSLTGILIDISNP